MVTVRVKVMVRVVVSGFGLGFGFGLVSVLGGLECDVVRVRAEWVAKLCAHVVDTWGSK